MTRTAITLGLLIISTILFAQTRTLDKSLTAGYTNSSYGVSPSGAATYEIPLGDF